MRPRGNYHCRPKILSDARDSSRACQDEFPGVDLLLAGDAGQFKQIAEHLALCWADEGRHYEKLMSSAAYHRRLLDEFLTEL